MPNWKKVITSGSNATLNNITASRLTLESSGSTIFDVVGSQGQLFSITDSLSGSLFAVSDISGLPILEVFSDDTVKIGSFNNKAIIVSGSNATITGSFTGSFTGDGSNLTNLPSSDPFPYTGSAVISGSLEVIGDITGSGKIDLNDGNNSVYIGELAGNSNNNNTFIGYDAGGNSSNSVAIGYQAGRTATNGNNVYIGYQTGDNAEGGTYRVALGAGAGTHTRANHEISIGRSANRFGTGENSIAIGRSAAYGNGSNSKTNLIAIGQNTGYGSDGTYNTHFQLNSGRNTTGNYNITLGANSGYTTTGDYNIILGTDAGYTVSGSNNILLGYQAGYNLTGSNQLIIANNSSSALVTGDFANNTFNISGSVSASTYYGDGSNLTGIETDPFPYTGSAVISGSLEVTGSAIVTGDITTNTLSNISTTLASDSATNVDTFATATYTGAIYDYILVDATVGARTGQFMVAQDNGNITFTDTSTKHLTDPVIPEISAQITGADVEVQVTNGNGYTFKSFVKKL